MTLSIGDVIHLFKSFIEGKSEMKALSDVRMRLYLFMISTFGVLLVLQMETIYNRCVVSMFVSMFCVDVLY